MEVAYQTQEIWILYACLLDSLFFASLALLFCDLHCVLEPKLPAQAISDQCMLLTAFLMFLLFRIQWGTEEVVAKQRRRWRPRDWAGEVLNP